MGARFAGPHQQATFEIRIAKLRELPKNPAGCSPLDGHDLIEAEIAAALTAAGITDDGQSTKTCDH